MHVFVEMLKHLQLVFVTCLYQMTVDVLVSQSHIVSLHSYEVTFVAALLSLLSDYTPMLCQLTASMDK